MREHLGGIYDFLQHKQMESLRELEKSVPSKTDNDQIQEPAVSSGKQSYAEKKEFEKQIRKAERLVKDAEAKVSQLEAELKVVEDKLAAGATEMISLNGMAKSARVWMRLCRNGKMLQWNWKI